MAKRKPEPVVETPVIGDAPATVALPVVDDAVVCEPEPGTPCVEPTLLERAYADPVGAYAIYQGIVAGTVKVALPWVGAARQTRLSPSGVVVGEIVHRGGGNYNAYAEGEAVGPKMMDEVKAKACVDAELTALGYGFVE